MKRLFLLSIVMCLSISLALSANQPVTVKLNQSGFVQSNVWKKYIGETTPDGTPEIIDWGLCGL